MGMQLQRPNAIIALKERNADGTFDEGEAILFDHRAEPRDRISAKDRGRLILMDPRRPLVVFSLFPDPIMPGQPRTPDQELAVRMLCKMGVLNIEDPGFIAHGLSITGGQETTAGRVLELAGTEPAR